MYALPLKKNTTSKSQNVMLILTPTWFKSFECHYLRMSRMSSAFFNSIKPTLIKWNLKNVSLSHSSSCMEGQLTAQCLAATRAI